MSNILTTVLAKLAFIVVEALAVQLAKTLLPAAVGRAATA